MATTAVAKLAILLEAEDNASSVIKAVGDQARDVGKVFLATGGAITGALGFAVKGAIDAETAMARFNTILSNSVGASEKVKKTLLESAQASQKFGFDSEDASLALARFFQRTGDVNTSLELFATTQDLARLKGIDLAQATDKLNLFLSGSPRLLKDIGVELGESATEMDKFRAIQKATTGQTEAFAQSTEGQFAILKQSGEDLRKAIGAPLISTINDIVKSVRPLLDRIAEWIKQNPELFAQIIKGTALLGIILTVIGAIGVALPPLIAGFHGMAVAFGIAKIGVGALTLAMQPHLLAIALTATAVAGLIALWREWLNTESIIQEGLDADAKRFEILTQRIKDKRTGVKEATDATKDLNTQLQNIAGDGIEKYFAGLEKAGKGTDDFKERAETALAKVKELQESLTQTVMDEATRQIDSRRQLAEKIVEQETIVLNLQKQLQEQGVNVASEADFKKFAELQDRLMKEQTALTLAHQIETGLVTETTEARRRAGLTDFERFVEDLRKKDELALADFNKKVLRITEELETVKKKNADILLSEESTKKSIETFHKNLTTEIVTQVNAQAQAVADKTNQIITQYNEAKRITAEPIVIRTQTSTPPTIGGGGFFSRLLAPFTQEGGIVTRPTLVVAGEAGDEAIIPLSRLSGAGLGGNVTINISGNTILGSDVDRLAKQVGDALINKLGFQLRI